MLVRAPAIPLSKPLNPNVTGSLDWNSKRCLRISNRLQAILDLEHMAGRLVEQHISVEIARDHMNLDILSVDLTLLCHFEVSGWMASDRRP